MYAYALGEKDQRLLLFSTDMVAKTLVSLPVKVDRVGETTIRPKLLVDLLHNLPKEEEVELGVAAGGNLDFKCALGKGKIYASGDTSLKSLITDMPFKESPAFEIGAGDLADLISRTEFCTTETRQLIMSAINLKTVENGFIAEAADGNIVAVSFVKDDKSPGPGKSAAIPSYGLLYLKGLLSRNRDGTVQVVFDKGPDGQPNKVYFKFAGVFFGMSLIAQKFPDINTVMDAAKSVKGPEFRIAYDTLRQVIQRAIPFSEDGKVRLGFKDNKLSVVTRGSATGRFEASVEGSSQDQKIENTHSLNARYLAPILVRNYGSNLTIRTTTDNSRTWFIDNDLPDRKTTYFLGCVKE